MILNDRLTRGFLAGLLGGIASLIWGIISKFIINFTDMLFGEFAAILVYGRPAVSLADNIFAQVAVFGFYGVCGIIFVFLIPLIKSENLLLKGCIWGTFIWFFSSIIALLFKVPGLAETKLNTSISQFLGGLLWGGVLAMTLRYFDKIIKTN